MHHENTEYTCGTEPWGLLLESVYEECLSFELAKEGLRHPIHESQLIRYLELANLPLGLPINFNVVRLRDGIGRRIHTPRSHWIDPPSSRP